jgi:RIO-like serine/threonine protein kinase
MVARKTATEELTLFEKLRKEVKVPKPLRVTQDIVLECPTKAQLERSQAGTTEEESNRILLGEENYDKLVALFSEESAYMWAEFHKAYLQHFFPPQTEQ